MISIYHWNSADCRDYLERIGQRAASTNSVVEQQVAEILSQVRQRGDAAVRQYTLEFDGCELEELRIPVEDIRSAAGQVDAELRRALKLAAENIRHFHERQLDKSWEMEGADGVRLGQRITPLQAVGLYVPGGTAAYPSSVMMNAIPAQVAGVPRIVVTTPYAKLRDNPVVAAVLDELGIQEVYGIGGAQAVAALAYGTESVAKVDKIVGPGNLFVATAKRQVFGVVDIDMIAGPSEVVVVADDTVNPDFVAADLMAQAEHDEEACALAVVFSQAQAQAIVGSLQRLIERTTRQETIRRSLERHGAVLVCPTQDQAAQAVNGLAPEHLEILFREGAEEFSSKIHSAGAIFLGPHSCEPVGDYFAGPNHVLPTSGTARFGSPLGVYDFIKRTSIIHYTRAALEKNRRYIEALAQAEHLDAHAQSVSIRFQKG
ncbi:MAG: histidinol dehydrogenase [Acidobacteriota bacterium]